MSWVSYSNVMPISDLKHSVKLSKSIENILSSLKIKLDKHGKSSKDLAVFLNGNKISIALINLNGKDPVIGGYNMDNFIYPASLYKIFIAAEALRQVENKKINLDKKIVVSKINAVDRRKQIPYDKHKILKSGERARVEYLLELMLSRSDNTAANCLIDLVDRENINKNIIKKYQWSGSEITRKFIPRKFEEKKWREAPVTLTCAKHVAEFFFLVEKGKIVSEKTSHDLKEFLSDGHHFEKDNIGNSLPKSAKFYRKGGWFESKLKDGSMIKFNSDAGIVEDGNIKYIIAILTSLKTRNHKKNFPVKKLSRKIYDLMKSKS